jgi:hypothetical protein
VTQAPTLLKPRSDFCHIFMGRASLTDDIILVLQMTLNESVERSRIKTLGHIF